jgi:hypothetical protein
VFLRDGDEPWRPISVPSPEAETYRTHRVDVDGPYREVAACRSGAGHARDNLQLRYIAAER